MSRITRRQFAERPGLRAPKVEHVAPLLIPNEHEVHAIVLESLSHLLSTFVRLRSFSWDHEAFVPDSFSLIPGSGGPVLQDRAQWTLRSAVGPLSLYRLHRRLGQASSSPPSSSRRVARQGTCRPRSTLTVLMSPNLFALARWPQFHVSWKVFRFSRRRRSGARCNNPTSALRVRAHRSREEPVLRMEAIFGGRQCRVSTRGLRGLHGEITADWHFTEFEDSHLHASIDTVPTGISISSSA